MGSLYDHIGKGYTRTRNADPRIAKELEKLLGLHEGSKVLDVGAGTGNYSCALAEAGYHVTALEPSKVMCAQGKQHSRLCWVEGNAEDLPFEAKNFDAVVMTLSMHHFEDWKASIREAVREAVRVAGNGPVVIFTFDPDFESGFWLLDYFPDLAEQAKEWFPKIADMEDFVIEEIDGELELVRFPLPFDIQDHFAAAGWARPEVYLEEQYRSGISHFASGDQEQIREDAVRLSRDLESGLWDRKFGELRNSKILEVGFLFMKIQRREQTECHQLLEPASLP
ncbi:MAG: methyltransferase domain-containing protein [Verrucomicrobiales bacterium]|nr:methyltransferase domain-containing protein [Verrucomicrobiales bacterium]